MQSSGRDILDTPLPNFVVKVCGITCLEDALASVRWGANALGFNFYRKSPRFIQPAEAIEIIQKLPSGIMSIAVMVNNQEVCDLAKPVFQALDVVQIHGVGYPSDLPDLGKRLWVAVSGDTAGRFQDHEIIVDSSWGSGQVADWKPLRALERPFILAGGLTNQNVRVALEELNLAGVDVCSGVESSAGRKDWAKLRSFLDEVGTWLRERQQ